MFRHPLNSLGKELRASFDFVLIDPPFITREVRCMADPVRAFPWWFEEPSLPLGRTKKRLFDQCLNMKQGLGSTTCTAASGLGEICGDCSPPGSDQQLARKRAVLSFGFPSKPRPESAKGLSSRCCGWEIFILEGERSRRHS